jgi:hypothetical protein
MERVRVPAGCEDCACEPAAAHLDAHCLAERWVLLPLCLRLLLLLLLCLRLLLMLPLCLLLLCVLCLPWQPLLQLSRRRGGREPKPRHAAASPEL